jgi:hypothetical protein
VIIRHPHPTISLTPHELSEAVQDYFTKRGPPNGRRIGNLVMTDLSAITNINGASRLAGQLTFELLPESET